MVILVLFNLEIYAFQGTNFLKALPQITESFICNPFAPMKLIERVC